MYNLKTFTENIKRCQMLCCKLGLNVQIIKLVCQISISKKFLKNEFRDEQHLKSHLKEILSESKMLKNVTVTENVTFYMTSPVEKTHCEGL